MAIVERLGSGQRCCATRRAASLIRDLLGPGARARGFAEVRILSEWASIVGPGLALRCQPLQVRFAPAYSGGKGSRRWGGGILYLQAGSAAALELQHSSRLIVERVNRFFGFAAIRGLRFVPTPMWAPENRVPLPPARVLTQAARTGVATSVAQIVDPVLREALGALGEHIHARPPEPTPPAPSGVAGWSGSL